MRTLIVHAHPEPRSLNGALEGIAVTTLREARHDVQVSDLYAMRWKPMVDTDDFGTASDPLRVAADAGRAYDTGTLTADIPPSRKSCAGPTR